MKLYMAAVIMALLILSGCAETAAPIASNAGADGKTAKKQSRPQPDMLTDDPDFMAPTPQGIGSSSAQDNLR